MPRRQRRCGLSSRRCRYDGGRHLRFWAWFLGWFRRWRHSSRFLPRWQRWCGGRVSRRWRLGCCWACTTSRRRSLLLCGIARPTRSTVAQCTRNTSPEASSSRRDRWLLRCATAIVTAGSSASRRRRCWCERDDGYFLFPNLVDDTRSHKRPQLARRAQPRKTPA